MIRIDLALRGEKIADPFDPIYSPRAREIIEARGRYILPGIIEAYAHLDLGHPMEYYFTLRTHDSPKHTVELLPLLSKKSGNSSKDFFLDRAKVAYVYNM